MADTIEIVLGGVVALIGKILFDWLARPKGDHRAGDKTVEWWEQKGREIVHEVMTERNDLLENMMRKIVREESRK